MVITKRNEEIQEKLSIFLQHANSNSAYKKQRDFVLDRDKLVIVCLSW